MTAATPPRPTRIMVCNTNSAHHTDEVTTLQTTVEYSTAVQIVSESVSDQDVETIIPNWVSGATVDSVGNFLCGHAEPPDYDDCDDDDDDGVHRRFLPVTPCVLSVSAGNHDMYMDTKCGVATFSTLCLRYNGDIKVTHTDECSGQDIRDAVMDILMELYHDRDFCLRLLDYTSDGKNVHLGRVVFGDKIDDDGNAAAYEDTGGYVDDNNKDKDDDEPVVTATITETSESRSAGGLNAGGVAILAAMGAFAALAALLLFLWCRARRRRRSNDDDAKSIHTNWSDPTADNSYLKPDFHDLGLMHSTADVHRCSSAFCEVCNRPNLGQVHLLPVGKLDLAGMQVQAEQDEQQQQYDDDDDDDDDLVPDSIYRVDDVEDDTLQDEPQEDEQAANMIARGAMAMDNQSGQSSSLDAILDADTQEAAATAAAAEQQQQEEAPSPQDQEDEKETITSYVQEDPDGYAFVRTERIASKDSSTSTPTTRLNDFQKAPRRSNNFGGIRVFQPKAAAASLPPQDDSNVNSVIL